jgi:hypothetical protein
VDHRGPGSIPRPTTSGLLARSPYSFRNALNTRHLLFDATRPDFVKAKNGVGFSPRLYQNRTEQFLLPLNCAWTSEDVPIGIPLKPLDSGHKVFVRVLTTELAKIDLGAKMVSKDWKQLERRDIIIKDIEKHEVVQTTWEDLTKIPPLVLTLKYPKQMHLRGFSTFHRDSNFRILLGPGRDFLTVLGYSHTPGGVDPFRIYRDSMTPTLTTDQACFRETDIQIMRFQVDIKRKLEPIELLVVVGFRNNDFAIKGWEWHGESHAITELDSIANNYTAKSDCTVFVDCNEPIKIALRPAPSQHNWSIETPVKEVTVTITL